MTKKVLMTVGFCLLLTFAGCGGGADEDAASVTDAPTEQVTATPTETATEIPLVGLSNESKGWGFRRMESGRPEFTAEQQKEMADYHCIYMGKDGEKRLYLTFDEGYENGYTAQILDVLQKTHTPAAFFVTGAYLEREPELVGRMVNEGHIVGNHTLNHPSMPSVIVDADAQKEICALDDRFFDLFGVHMTYFRPPKGEYSARTLAIANNLGYTNVFWSAAYQDWDVNVQKGVDYAYTQIMDQLHPGCVMLLHAVSPDNANVLERFITDARSQGYEFYSLDDYQ